MMQRVLLIRLSALGDIIHSLPVIADIRQRWPNALIDMAVDERFIEIPQLNRDVNRTISLPLKRIKKNVFHKSSWSELYSVIKNLRAEHYDLVIDLHGMIKSAAVSFLARSTLRVGFEVRHCPEKPAALFYNKHFQIKETANKVDWLRCLAAFALGAESSGKVNYGLPLRPNTASTLRKVVFFHSSSDNAKNWPEPNWVALGKRLIVDGYRIELSWGNELEKDRARQLQYQLGKANADLAPFRPLREWVQHFSELALVVGLDTGLTHLAAAVGTPCVGVFSVTRPTLLVPQKPDYAKAVGGNGRTPMVQEVIDACNSILQIEGGPQASKAAELFELP